MESIRIEYENEKSITDKRIAAAWIGCEAESITMNIGYQWENVQKIFFDYGKWAEKYGKGGTIKGIFKPKEGKPYEIKLERVSENVVMWHPDHTTEKKLSGFHRVQFIYEVGEVRVHSVVFGVLVLKHI